jgi:SAM-dependent methyltransferase
MIERAKARLNGKACLLVADISQRLDFADDDSFDIVVGSLVLHYVERWQPVLREFRRVLRPGGVVVFSTHHPTMDWELTPGDYFAVRQVTDRWTMGEDTFEVTFWRRPLTEMTSAIADAGFLIEQLVEPQPSPELSQRDAEAYRKLTTAPRFLFFRVVPAAAP